MILQQLRQLLRQNEIEPEESQGKPFDPLRHEAIGSRRDQPSLTIPCWKQPSAATIEARSIFRPAKVIVNDLSQ